jgi:hypothetical protein
MYIVAKSLSDPQPISLTQRAVKERVNIPLGKNHRNIIFFTFRKSCSMSKWPRGHIWKGNIDNAK